jgi:SNF2 family DNA or RNA helicase
MKIINNQDSLLIDELKKNVNSESNLYICTEYFTSNVLYELNDIIKTANKVNLLVSYNFKLIDDYTFIFDSLEKKSNKDLNRQYKLGIVKELLTTKVEIREGNLGAQNIIIVENKGVSNCFAITPMNLNMVSVGVINSDKPIYINTFDDTNNQYLGLFKNAWDISKVKLNDIIIQRIEKGLKNYSGEAIYKYSIKEIFQYSTTNERADEKLKKVGFKNSKIWSLLYNFQKDAVIGAIEKIETYGGCIIADSVGLGKTFEALAIMKYYQLRNDRILVLAPKKLRENWTVFQQNDIYNILSEDRLNYDVLNHTDLSRETGKSGDINLETINWGNYDLIVIDESHNFRNNPNKREGVTRYKRLMNDVIKANIRTKVLMLSATPVNNKMNDLKNQISFITEGDDEYFASYGIDSITQVMRDAQRKFTSWLRNGDPNNLNVNSLMEHLDGSYFRILDMLTIARSRKHIEKYYDTTDIGKFPQRLTPKTVYPDIDTNGLFKNIGEIYDEISTLTLASYSPLGYVRSDKRDYYERKYDMETSTGSIFKQVDREESLIYLMRINLLKRLESSIHSFKLTIERLIEIINTNLKQLELHQTGNIDLDLNITDIDIDDTELEDLLIGGKTKILIQDIDTIKWKQDLKLDKTVLVNLMTSISLIDSTRDAKLFELKKIISNKISTPINKGNKKIIVFTAFADTAKYMHEQLSEWINKEFGLFSALVTGSATNKTNMPGCKSDLSSILTNFSPVSKKRNDINPTEQNQIDILFCTDCISEGQNLQDCDFLINYDIHWNPVRIIQRFGRIDRIGSINDKIQLVNFFPNMELDSFIDLVARVQGKMIILDVSATGEDNIISQNSREMQDLDYRKKQLKQLQNQVIDLEDVQGSISITDLTFNDFKIDLEKSTDDELLEIKQIPPASYAIVKSNLENIKKGVIFCLKDEIDNYAVKLKNNILYPFFLVYISMDGLEIIKASQTKTALDYYRKLCMGNNRVLQDLVTELNTETSNSKNVDKYKKLLVNVVQEVNGVQEEIGIDSLATPGGTILSTNVLGEDDKLELISYLIIR